jgi:hypothetical protein
MFWRPDALGITPSRYAVEIEAKISKADFLKDREKPQYSIREDGRDHWVRQFYYLVPRPLLSTVMPLLPDWAGMLQPTSHYWGALEVVKKAPVNTTAKKYSINALAKCVRAQTNQLISYVEELMNKADSKLLEDLEAARKSAEQNWKRNHKLEDENWKLKLKLKDYEDSSRTSQD